MKLPQIFPKYLTEFEVINIIHYSFASIIIVMRCIAEYLYVDIELTTISVINDLCIQHQVSVLYIIIIYF
jgi:hypothetical protein